MPVWQRIYEEIDNPDFVIICAAQDTGGEAVAGPIFDAAGATYIQIVDENHRISSLFNFVNVPSSAWIDETGRIVRIDEGTYSQIHAISDGQETITFGNDVYTPALKDWIENGENSPYINAPEQVSENIRTHSKEQLKADAAFCLGNFFRVHGHNDLADHYWALAQTLNPESINFFRQNLTLTEEGSAGNTFRQRISEYISQGKDYYRPLDI